MATQREKRRSTADDDDPKPIKKSKPNDDDEQKRPMLKTRQIGRQRTADDEKKLADADAERRRLHGPWIRKKYRGGNRQYDVYDQPLADLLSNRPSGERYRDDLVDVRPVTATDGMPAAVIGQLGVVATADIDDQTLIGIYEGRTYRTDESCKTVDFEYHMDGSAPFVTDDDQYVTADPTTADDADLYGLSEAVVKFTIDPSYPFGNGVLERINDYRLDVSVPDDLTANPLDRCNVYAQQLFSADGEPFTCIVSFRRIRFGQSLLMDYGPAYWRSKLTSKKTKTK